MDRIGLDRPTKGTWAIVIATLLLMRVLGIHVGTQTVSAGDESAPSKPADVGSSAGREASSPADIPAQGWKAIILRTYKEISQDRVTAVAAGVTYFALFAIFPAIASLVAIYGIFTDVATLNDHLQIASGFLPGGATEIIGDQIKRVSAKGGATLSFAFATGLCLSIWSANAGMKAIFDALNVAYGETEKRGFFRLNLTSLAFTFGAVLMLLFGLAAVAIVPLMLNLVGLGNTLEWVIYIGRWPALLAVVVMSLALIYRYGPSRKEPKWRWITPGSLLAGVVWLTSSMLFSWYVSSYGSYNQTYGSLGAVIGLMTWLWLSTNIVLVGAELNAEIEHQTARDTTKGAEQPLGARGARMADTVAQ